MLKTLSALVLLSAPAFAQVWVCDQPSCTAWESEWPYTPHTLSGGSVIDEDYDDLLPTQPPYHDEEPEDNGWIPLGGYDEPYDPQHQPPMLPWWFPCLAGCLPGLPISNTPVPTNPAWLGLPNLGLPSPSPYGVWL